MALPNKVKAGDPIRATDWNALLDFVRSIIPLPSAGIRVKRGAGGTTFSVSQQPFARTNGGTVYDFTLTPATMPGGSAGVQLSFGNVTGLGISLNSDDEDLFPWPQEMLPTNTPPWSDTKSVAGLTTWYAELVVTVDDDPAGDGSRPPVITSISWDVFSTYQNDVAPYTTSGDTTGTYYFLLGNGSLSADGNSAIVANSTGKGSQMFSYCGGVAVWNPSGPCTFPTGVN